MEGAWDKQVFDPKVKMPRLHIRPVGNSFEVHCPSCQTWVNRAQFRSIPDFEECIPCTKNKKMENK